MHHSIYNWFPNTLIIFSYWHTSLTAYSHADWTGCPYTHRSTMGWCIYLGEALISWKCKKQDKVSKSSMEPEYCAMSSACSEILGLRGLLSEIGFPQTTSTPLHTDNTTPFASLRIQSSMTTPNMSRWIVISLGMNMKSHQPFTCFH